jgi:UDP-N-acetylmuramoyl-tripeptide--D-alanyl-D-alanine ligase
VAFACSIGVPLTSIPDALARYQPEGLRLRRQKLPNGVEILNDAYNANPASMLASLSALAHWPGRRFAVLGDMLELGRLEAELHEQVLDHAVSLGLDGLLVLGPRMAAAAGKLGVPVALDAVAAARWLLERARAGDCALLKGSRGARVERVSDELLLALGSHR